MKIQVICLFTVDDFFWGLPSKFFETKKINQANFWDFYENHKTILLCYFWLSFIQPEIFLIKINCKSIL